MISTEFIEISAADVRYYSPGDEANLFHQLSNIDFIKNVEGRGDTIFISIVLAEVEEEGLRDLLALFRRYRVPAKQFRQFIVFDREEFAYWFRHHSAPWHKAVFADAQK